MPDRAPPARAQTIKQAKAAFKARGGAAMSDKEQKQLQRAVELDLRAQRTREADKKRAEANKRKLEREKSDSETRARLQLATQRRRDKFGYKSSQMHLGPFFIKKAVATDKSDGGLPTTTEVSSDDSFGDSDPDDETLLEAMDAIMQKQPVVLPAKMVAPPSGELVVCVTAEVKQNTHIPAMEDLTCFFDDLGSSTQIARELSADEPGAFPRSGASKASSSYDDFDFTADDIQELESRQPVKTGITNEQVLMPPPLLLAKLPKSGSTSIFDDGLTIQELEDFLGDDIQLTQAEPG